MNIGLNLILAKTMLTDTRMKTTTKLLRDQTKNDKLQIISLAELGVVYAPLPGVRIIVAFSEDLATLYHRTSVSQVGTVVLSRILTANC